MMTKSVNELTSATWFDRADIQPGLEVGFAIQPSNQKKYTTQRMQV